MKKTFKDNSTPKLIAAGSDIDAKFLINAAFVNCCNGRQLGLQAAVFVFLLKHHSFHI